MLHSYGLQPCLQALDQDGKACQGKTLQLFTKIRKFKRLNIYNIGPWPLDRALKVLNVTCYLCPSVNVINHFSLLIKLWKNKLNRSSLQIISRLVKRINTVRCWLNSQILDQVEIAFWEGAHQLILTKHHRRGRKKVLQRLDQKQFCF